MGCPCSKIKRSRYEIHKTIQLTREQEKSKRKQLKVKKQLVLAQQIKLYSSLPPEDDITSYILQNQGQNDTDKSKFQVMQLLHLAAQKQNVNIQYSNQISKSQIGLISMLTSGFQNMLSLSIHFDEGDNGKFGTLNYDLLKQTPQSEEQFEGILTKNLAQICGVQQKNVHLTSCIIVRGSVQVEVIIKNVNQRNYRDVVKDIETYSGRSIQTSIKDPTYVLRLEDFESQGIHECPNKPSQGQLRGGLEYYQPSAPWVQYELNIKDKTNKWFRNDGKLGQWAIAYHCFTKPVEKIVLQGPQKQQHQDYASEGRGGVYCTPQIKAAEQQSAKIKLNGCDYIVVIQCRVKRSSMQKCGHPNYCVVNDPKDVRPYGICFKKVESNFQDKQLTIKQQNLISKLYFRQYHRQQKSLIEVYPNPDQYVIEENQPQKADHDALLLYNDVEPIFSPISEQVNYEHTLRPQLKFFQKDEDQSKKNKKLTLIVLQMSQNQTRSGEKKLENIFQDRKSMNINREMKHPNIYRRSKTVCPSASGTLIENNLKKE